ncbi:MAG: oligopeptide ABC transporter ATP-binding protein [Thermotoga sp.]|nr:MAG: oligopeptide ABC transporter ATP-binding protein [Thermotoga sp.]
MDNVIVKVENLKKWFPIRRTIGELFRHEQKWVRAVDGITFSIDKGKIFGLVGESGCGKTTTGKLLMKLLEPTGGKIMFEGKDVTHLEPEALKKYRRSVQMIFQDPYASMNPRFRARDVLEEPLIIHHISEDRAEREKLVSRALEEVRLIPPEEFMSRFPHMLSGGQRQRVATARTLILSPSMIVADEPVSMIDLSTRAEILHMMKAVQRELNLTYLYITHDLSTARYFTDQIAVMYLGKIVEMGESDEIIDHPVHPYTKALIAAVCEPVSGKVNRIKEVPIKGEVPSAEDIPRGCRFHPRCVYARTQCWKEEEPQLVEVSSGHWAACRIFA